MSSVKFTKREIWISFIGKHETCDWPCYLAKPSSCHKPCGRILACENHTCTLECHIVDGAPNDVIVEFFFCFVFLHLIVFSRLELIVNNVKVFVQNQDQMVVNILVQNRVILVIVRHVNKCYASNVIVVWINRMLLVKIGVFQKIEKRYKVAEINVRTM